MPVEKPVLPWPDGTDKHPAQGFRAMAGTTMDEALDEQVDLIEHQLSHAVKVTNGRV
jgi:hypothetical protein